uniref:Uncharacterized protein n=1 Tax=Anguilla anguilla TaxID=7936 RepID=A0A0E9QWS7_ANGAN
MLLHHITRILIIIDLLIDLSSDSQDTLIRGFTMPSRHHAYVLVIRAVNKKGT